MNVPKDTRKEESESKGENSVLNTRASELDTEQTTISNVARPRSSSSCRELLLPNTHHGIFHSTIPKHITTFDEKYVLRCLELLRNCALKATASNFTSKVHILPEEWSNLAESKMMSSHNMVRLAVECPLAAENQLFVNSADDSSIGSVIGSQSVLNILKSPLLQQFGSVDFDFNFGRKNLLEPVCSNFSNYSHELSMSNSSKLECKNYLSAPRHKRIVSLLSTYSDNSPSSASAISFQGILKCTWKNGLPQHVFNIDNKTEVYIGSLSMAEPSGDNVSDYVYTFCTRKSGKKECDTGELESQSVGTMRVSTSNTFDSNNSSQVKETKFILSLSNDDPMDELQISNRTHRKSKKLTSKVAKVFKSSHSYKQRSLSKFSGSSAIFEDADKGIGTRAENDYTPNFEVAAIIVKDVSKNSKEDNVGGWGLKFLKKLGKDVSLKTIMPSEFTRNYGVSLDVLIPAGVHGGPKARVGGPSSLIERWISGGRCDCGGWDIGCPLTVLNAGPTNSSFVVDNSGGCKSVDLFMQGSKRDIPIFKMANINDGLYCVHFQSNLSALQSFAIAAAIIHSHCPVLQSEVYRA